MTKRRTIEHEAPEDLFRALADPTRLRVVERLALGPAAVSELAEPFDMALPSFLKHLRVLEACGIVVSEKRGRVRTCRLDPARLQVVEHWLGRQRRIWERRLDQLDQYVQSLEAQPEENKS